MLPLLLLSSIGPLAAMLYDQKQQPREHGSSIDRREIP
jgi:hypothetical protein